MYFEGGIMGRYIIIDGMRGYVVTDKRDVSRIMGIGLDRLSRMLEDDSVLMKGGKVLYSDVEEVKSGRGNKGGNVMSLRRG